MSSTAPTSLACPACGAALLAGDRFCEACGAGLPFTEAPPPEALAKEAQPDEAQPAATLDDEASLHGAPGVAGQTPVEGSTCASCGAAAADAADGYCGVCGMKQPAARDHLEVDHDTVAAVTDRGRRHRRNEDAFALHVGTEATFVVVCDGVSTTMNPDLAAQAASDAALGALVAGAPPDGPPGSEAVPALLLASHRAAESAVEDVEGTPEPGIGWPSCTFLAVIVIGTDVALAGLGDCRAIWLPNAGEPEILTQDHSWAADKIATGALLPEEAYTHPLAHTITRWLGRDAEPSWEPRLVRFHAPGPGRLVLCSDGLWNYAGTGPELAAAAAGDGPDSGSALATARRLVDYANEQGGHDNITVAVVDMASRPPPDDTTQTRGAQDDRDPTQLKGQPS